MQKSFDPLTYQDAIPSLSIEQASKLALRARNTELKALRSNGVGARGWTLRGQLKQYKSFGVEDGRIRNVYYINHN